ncbi:MAG: HD domain-containing protein [Betaproteobacteria bacterium]|nr:HD domain-containing protein [Betaproteobacteria bacterium]
MAAERTQLEAGDLVAGESLPLDVYTRTGVLLLARGQVVLTERQLARLLEEGIWGEAETVARLREERGGDAAQTADWRKVSVFHELETLRNDLGALFGSGNDAGLPGGLADCAMRLRRAVSLDVDAAIASIQWLRTSPYAIRQSVNVAVLSEVLLGDLEVPDDVRTATAAAALAMNLSIVEVQEALFFRQAMTPEEKSQIARHPQAAVDRLTAAGVDDTLLLQAVLEHHEAHDGTGYPRKLAGDAIGLPARVISVADKFCATVSERAYRAAVPCSIALRKLLTDAGPTMDTQVAARLARAVGIYPPGTVVRLKNGETAMAVKRTLDPQAPVVRLVRSRDGVLTSTYSKRLTSKLAFAVTEEAGRSALPEGFDALQLWNPALERGED